MLTSSKAKLKFRRFYLNMDLLEIWVFNAKTGTVYKKEVFEQI
jgi:hypothetical protein